MAGIGHTLPTHGLADIELPDRYALVRHIADGGMASVWCAQDSLLSRKVAIKVLAPRFRQDDRAVRCFEREARAAARLSTHRNIITIYDVGETWALGDAAEGTARVPGPPFIVMEHLAGGTVADALRHRHVSLEEARGWIHEAAAALDYAHEQGVVHGDVKPANMLLDGNSVLHIADFGIARIAHEDTISGTGNLFGTAAYISPEQALGERASAASDRYALAVVSFELLAGQRPFTTEGFAALARCHVEQEPPAASSCRPTLPPSLDPVLRRGMAKHPGERWPTAAALAAAIDAGLFERRVSFSPAGAPLPAGRRRPRRPHLGGRPKAWLAATAAVAALAVAGIVATQSGAPKRGHLVAASRSPHASASTTPALVHATRQPATSTPANHAPGTKPAAPRRPSSTQSADSLEAQGHSLMLAGRYNEAVQVLEQALHAAAPGSLVYQWALYDLGHSYRELGDLQAAIPLLQERLGYPDERQIVQNELNAALSQYRADAAPGSSPAGANTGGGRAGGPPGDGPPADGPPGDGPKHGHNGG